MCVSARSCVCLCLHICVRDSDTLAAHAAVVPCAFVYLLGLSLQGPTMLLIVHSLHLQCLFSVLAQEIQLKQKM